MRRFVLLLLATYAALVVWCLGVLLLTRQSIGLLGLGGCCGAGRAVYLVCRARLTSAPVHPEIPPDVTKNALMADAALLFLVLLLEIASPIVLAGLLFIGIRSLVRARRLAGRCRGPAAGINGHSAAYNSDQFRIHWYVSTKYL